MQFLCNLTAYALNTLYSLNIQLLRRELDCSVTGVYAGKLNVLTDGVSNNLTVLGNGLHLTLLGVLNESAYYNRMFL